ncbi:protein of unknown function DUF433 [Microseira wollei NIES-4236]|uniref:DUF433 domain-containing protein n=2 Tax=Microseira wollei TaxID=467598 RepID=A0AAV3XB22_9CYAN|nr:DUF433 domain-containing protein [Microseira wollei]GET37604.1 protein of unknown function DUF433 [Microseira wollei NIES-4236]
MSDTLPRIGFIDCKQSWSGCKAKTQLLKYENRHQSVQAQPMDWQSRITLDPNILVGKPIIKGTRLAVEFIIDLLAQGWTTDEILRNYPGITLEDIQACLG